MLSKRLKASGMCVILAILQSNLHAMQEALLQKGHDAVTIRSMKVLEIPKYGKDLSQVCILICDLGYDDNML